MKRLGPLSQRSPLKFSLPGKSVLRLLQNNFKKNLTLVKKKKKKITNLQLHVLSPRLPLWDPFLHRSVRK